MAANDTLSGLAEQLALALDPLCTAASSPAALRDFLEELGWNFPAAPAALDAVRTAATPVNAMASSVGAIGPGDIGPLLAGVRAVFTAISDLGAAGGLPADFRAEFPRQLVDYLLVEYLLKQQPRVGYLLLALGVLQLQDRPPSGGRPAYQLRRVAYEEFGKLFSEPLVFLKSAYHWGDSGFDFGKLADSLQGLLLAWNLNAYDSLVGEAMAGQLNAGAINPATTAVTALHLALVEHSVDPAAFAIGVGLFPLPETAAAKPGFALLPYATARLETDIPLSDRLSLGLEGDIDLAGGVGALVRPGKDIQFLAGLGSGTPATVGGNLSVSVRLGKAGEPLVVIGSADGSHLEVAGISTLGGTRFHSGGKFEVYTEFALESGKIVVKPGAGESDGFLAKLLPSNGLQVPFDLNVGFSTTRGMYFGGSGGLEVALPAHIQLGPVEIVSALLAVRVKDGGIPVELAATIKGDLSVIKATVENIGLTANFTFPADRKGNLGPANLAMGFRPPNGVALAVDTGVVKGGGYLYLDYDKGEYAGALELTFANFLSLKAIGLINTKMPGGQPGFSLLVIITAEFVPGFQLGFGFVLAGVGGLLGLNRTMLLEPLAQGLRTGAVNNILFPTNVVENAPRIISDLRVIFPPADGKFLIGPMAKLGWGTPTLISISLGIVVEIPGNIAILGRLRVNLPTETNPLVLLQVSFLGAIEFDKRRIWFFASLYESRVLFITLDGEMGLLMDFSDNPNFVLSVGGFHPRYTAPALPFPSPQRIALNIINESFARIRLEGYFAVTSNSVQFGSRTDMFFGFDALSVEGGMSFDALVRFSPLYFVVEISSHFAVKVFGAGVWGVHLRGSLEGPAPWRVRGTAEISVLFFSVSVDVDVTFGDRNSDTLPPVQVMSLIKTELSKAENWTASLPPSGQLLTSLRKLEPSAGLVLHPVGSLRVSQRAVPLNLKFSKIGNQQASDVNQLSLELSASGLKIGGPAREQFARAQFQDLDDAQKLSQPSFEKLDGGVDIRPDGALWAAGPAAERVVRYETIVIDTLFERFLIRFFPFWGRLFDHFRAGSAIRRSALSQTVQRQRRPFETAIELPGDRYVVAFSSNNRPMSQAAVFGSFAEAQQHMDQSLAANPALHEALHVIPAAEMSVTA